jgi:hypothetical protein
VEWVPIGIAPEQMSYENEAAIVRRAEEVLANLAVQHG